MLRSSSALLSGDSNDSIDYAGNANQPLQLWHGRIEALAASAVGGSRHVRRLVLSAYRIHTDLQRTTHNDDGDDEGGDITDDDDDDGPSEAVLGSKRVPKQRIMVFDRDCVPFAHVGASVCLLLAPLAGDKTFTARRCTMMRAAPRLKHAMLRAALVDPHSLMCARNERRAEKSALCATGALRESRLTTKRKNRSDTPLNDKARAALVDMRRSLMRGHVTGLAALFGTASQMLQIETLQRALEFYYALCATGTLAMGNVRGALPRACTSIVRAPFSVRASLVELLAPRALLRIALYCRQRSSGPRYFDAMFASAVPLERQHVRVSVLCGLRTYKDDTSIEYSTDVRAPSCGAIVPCGADFIAHRWPCSDPRDDLSGKEKIAMLGMLPPATGGDFMWRAAVQLRAVSAHTRYGDTLFDCGETLGTGNVDDDDDDDDDEMLIDDDDPPLVCAPTCSGWLVSRGTLCTVLPTCETPRISARAAQETHADKYTRQLVCTARAKATTNALVALLCDRDIFSLELYSTRAGACGARALTDEAYYGELVEHALPPHFSAVMLLFLSDGHRAHFVHRIISRHPQRYAIYTATVAELLRGEWHTRAALAIAQRMVVFDAHALCEHDFVRALRAICAMRQHDPAIALPLALFGDEDCYAAPSHSESGAPFADMWHSSLRHWRRVNVPTEWLRVPPDELASVDRAHLLALAAGCRDSPTHAARLAQHLTCASVQRSRRIAIALLTLEPRNTVHWQIGGTGRAALANGAQTLAAAVERCGGGERLAKDVVTALRLFARLPFLLRHTVLQTAPYVLWRGAVLRVRRFYVLTVQDDRTTRASVRSHMRELLPERDGVTVSLDAAGLHLELDDDDDCAAFADHKRCCMTSASNLVCVARHRAQLSAASIVLARDALAAHSVPSRTWLVLARNANDSSQYGASGVDASQLLGAIARARGDEPSFSIVLPSADRDALVQTAGSLERVMQFYYSKPNTMLGHQLASLAPLYAMDDDDRPPHPVSGGDDGGCDFWSDDDGL